MVKLFLGLILTISISTFADTDTKSSTSILEVVQQNCELVGSDGMDRNGEAVKIAEYYECSEGDSSFTITREIEK